MSVKDQSKSREYWIVEWISVNGEFSTDKKISFETFPTRQKAYMFAERLKTNFNTAQCKWLANSVRVYTDFII